MNVPIRLAAFLLPWLIFTWNQTAAEEPRQFSGIYPQLAMYNSEGECGTGAIVQWADRLWVITYGPHLPYGSSDKLYEITPDLTQIIRPESVGGTPANRLIHRETQQLLIGPYVIDEKRNVRVIPPTKMPGRLTGTARHLTDPANKAYYATMEEGLYEVDLHTLAVTGLLKDKNSPKPGQTSEDHPAQITPELPGYHGKGLYTGQGRLIYAQNGERGPKASVDATIASGALAEWRGSGDWQLVRRNQFTEVTGPGGIYGSEHPDTDPVWSVGWDYRSLILALCDHHQWSYFRLPIASHAYDGAHGWHTEWPRIREIGTPEHPELLMTMHGLWWKFPRTFSTGHTAGIAPRSAFLKVTGDFCRYQDRIVIGCDDACQSEFSNKRQAKATLSSPGQSQSNLWFIQPQQLDEMGPATAGGAVWLQDKVQAGEVSEPFLFNGWPLRGAFFQNGGEKSQTYSLEVDARGNGQWSKLRDVEVATKGSVWTEFPPTEVGEWIRVRAAVDSPSASAYFSYVQPDQRGKRSAAIFNGLASVQDATYAAGRMLDRAENRRTMALAAMQVKNGEVTDTGYYELDAQMSLKRVDDSRVHDIIKKKTEITPNVVQVEEASVLVIDDRGRRWRLPKGDAAFDRFIEKGLQRIDREIVTERDVFNCHGTCYELPGDTADGFAHLRPIASHSLALMDSCSYRGLMVLTGLDLAKSKNNSHVITSDDGRAAVWVGAIDDLWQLGKPVGHGGPWKNSAVKAEVPSDPYLIGFYDRRTLHLSHQSSSEVKFRVEVDPSGHGPWMTYREIVVPAGKMIDHVFPAAFSARWLRVISSQVTTATAWLDYE